MESTVRDPRDGVTGTGDAGDPGMDGGAAGGPWASTLEAAPRAPGLTFERAWFECRLAGLYAVSGVRVDTGWSVYTWRWREVRVPTWDE